MTRWSWKGPYWEPRDIWVGLYWTKEARLSLDGGMTWLDRLAIYVCILPCWPVRIRRYAESAR